MSVPADAEFVIEGIVNPGERRTEGPFGDHFGHYSHAAPFPVFHVREVTHRERPIFHASVVGKPPQEDKYMGEAVQEMFTGVLKVIHPEITDLWAYFEAGFHNLLVVAVENRFAKEGKKTALGLMGTGQLSLTKAMPGFNYDASKGKFRSYLKTIVVHAISARSRQNPRDSALGEGTQTAPAAPDGGGQEPWEAEWRQYHLRQAIKAVRAEFKASDLAAFEGYVNAGRDPSSVARELGMSVDSVYQAKSRILRKLSETIARQVEEEG